MRLSDLFASAVKNLKRRRLRSVLTILGVTIGTASVVTMLSIGYGMERLTEQLYSSFGSMSLIEVRMPYSMQSSDNPNYLTDKTVAELEKLDHIDYISPKLRTSVILKQGSYTAETELYGVTEEYLKRLDLAYGEIPSPGTMSLIMGNIVITSFNKEKSRTSYWMTGILPDVDYKKPLYIIYDSNAYYEAQNSTDSKTSMPKKYMIPVAGEIAGGTENYNENAFGTFVELETLKEQLKKIYRKKAIPGQPLNKKKKPYNYFIYDQIDVYCDNTSVVTEVQKQITDMGYTANSNMEWLEQSKEQSNMLRAALGGIGAISLLVAAIGIANTMMMSIYERTKEIGIMKVLGCDMNEIRKMFLIESGFIGLIGGIAGMLLSFLISFSVNHLGLAQQFTNMSGNLSYIPVWLPPVSVAFATLISMSAGFIPATKAMKLSPLEAIRNE